MYFWSNQTTATRKEEVHVNENSHMRSKEQMNINVTAKVRTKRENPFLTKNGAYARAINRRTRCLIVIIPFFRD